MKGRRKDERKKEWMEENLMNGWQMNGYLNERINKWKMDKRMNEKNKFNWLF
jgi:hypothetical protein